jgi:DUF1680 family protein
MRDEQDSRGAVNENFSRRPQRLVRVEENDETERVLADESPAVDFDPDPLGSVVTLAGTVAVPADDAWSELLYRSVDDVDRERATYTAVPFYAWGNRDPGGMRIWLREAGPTDSV